MEKEIEKNPDEILETPSRRNEIRGAEGHLKRDREDLEHVRDVLDHTEFPDMSLLREWQEAERKNIAEVSAAFKDLENLKEKDQEDALVLNKEFDRIMNNISQKAEELQKARDEFEEFRKKLNAKVE